MQRKDIPGTASSSGLSTDDLARPRERAAQEGAADTSTDVPTFPGESTPTPSTLQDEAAGADVEAQDEVMGADSSRQQPAADQDRQAEDQDHHAEDEVPQLLSPEDEEGFRTRWEDIQNRFVDDPRDAVHTADALVADVMQQLATTFADHKQELEGQWNRGEQADTEDLRQALRHYRSFFNRLLVT